MRTSGALKIVKNGIELRKYSPQSGGVNNSKKTNHRTLQMPILKHSKNSLDVALLVLEV
jgi:hypothetical protein